MAVSIEKNARLVLLPEQAARILSDSQLVIQKGAIIVVIKPEWTPDQVATVVRAAVENAERV